MFVLCSCTKLLRNKNKDFFSFQEKRRCPQRLRLQVELNSSTLILPQALIFQLLLLPQVLSGPKIYRGYSNVFVKYVFYFTSEVDNIYIS